MMSRRQLGTALLALVAAAILLALSFVATPVKFLAQGVPLADLLAVGRVTFRASLAVELCLLLPLLVLAQGPSRWLVATAAAILAGQWLVLMPQLDARTLARIAGEIVAPSSLHAWWIAADAMRIAAYLLVVGYCFRHHGLRSGNAGHRGKNQTMGSRA